MHVRVCVYVSLFMCVFFKVLIFLFMLQVTCKCVFSCRLICLDYRQELFQKCYDVADYNKQQSFLQRLIHPQMIKRRRYGKYDHPLENKRQHSFSYHIILPGGSDIRVCLTTICSTIRVMARRVQLLGEKILAGKMLLIKEVAHKNL